MRKSESLEWEEHSMQSFVCAKLLGLIKTQAVRKFVIYSENPKEDTKSLLVGRTFESRVSYGLTASSFGFSILT